MSYVVSIRKDQVIVSRGVMENEVTAHVSSVEEFIAVVTEYDETMYFSSTMDFPRDSTSNPQTLALVQAIREACES